MGELPQTRTDLTSGAQSNLKHHQPSISSMAMHRNIKKKHLGGPMNQEEVKMNRDLLKEISTLKKQMGERYTSPLNMSPDKSKRGLELDDLDHSTPVKQGRK